MNNTCNPKLLFLIDGCGALLSAFLLGVVLTEFESIIGMPRNILYLLAFLPCVFTVYDFACYFWLVKSGQHFMGAIAIFNLVYCCISIALVMHHYYQLTVLGLIYFILEFILIIFLAGFELQTAANSCNIKPVDAEEIIK